MMNTTDYGVLMELFIDVMTHQDAELKHKSFMVKIKNKLTRHNKRNLKACRYSEIKARRAIDTVHKQSKSTEISLGAICWLIQNKHKDILKPYGFDKKPFEDMNKYYNAQGVIMQTAKILTMIEEEMNG